MTGINPTFPNQTFNNLDSLQNLKQEGINNRNFNNTLENYSLLHAEQMKLLLRFQENPQLGELPVQYLQSPKVKSEYEIIKKEEHTEDSIFN